MAALAGGERNGKQEEMSGRMAASAAAGRDHGVKAKGADNPVDNGRVRGDEEMTNGAPVERPASLSAYKRDLKFLERNAEILGTHFTISALSQAQDGDGADRQRILESIPRRTLIVSLKRGMLVNRSISEAPLR